MLRVAKHQVRLAQTRAASRMQDALVDIEDALSDHIAWLQSAAQDDETNAKSEAELQRAAWRPLLRAA